MPGRTAFTFSVAPWSSAEALTDYAREAAAQGKHMSEKSAMVGMGNRLGSLRQKNFR